MPFNVLLLPLLGGYIFISCWNRTRFDASRQGGQRLLFHSAAYGVAFLIAAFVITKKLGGIHPELRIYWRHHVYFPYAGTSLTALIIGSVAWMPLNGIFRRTSEAKRSIVQSDNYFERLLLQALEETKAVLLSLKNGKVYVGFIVRNFDPAFDRKYVSILPLKSGYRRDDLTVEFTTDYARVYEKMVDDNVPVGVSQEDFQIVIPVSEIQSANLFDPVAYQLFALGSSAINGRENS